MRLRLGVAVLDWHDGDTFHGVLDHGLGLFRGAGLEIVGFSVTVKPIRFRCWGIDAPELGTARARSTAGVAALAAARELAPAGLYEAVSYKPDDFGRPLVDLVLPDGRLFSGAMIEGGFATRKEA